MKNSRDTSPEVFATQSSQDSAFKPCARDVRRIFPSATYCVSNADQSVWVLDRDEFGWNLLRTSHKSSQLSKKDFNVCCIVTVDTFLRQETKELEIDPFEPVFDAVPPLPPVVHLVSAQDNHDIKISTTLFMQLFRRGTVLFGSDSETPAACIFGLPDGRVFLWHPAAGKNGHLLCHMFQPVVDILPGPEGRLLCVGQQGKVIFISPGRETTEFSLAFLHGPVTSCCCNGKHLFHTTLQYHLFKSTLTFSSQGQGRVTQCQLPVVSGKKVQIEPFSNKVVYVSVDNIMCDVPDDAVDTTMKSQNKVLQWLSRTISDQHERTQTLLQTSEKYTTILHDLTCAAWLLTPDKCGLKCKYNVQPVPGQDRVYNIRITFSELGKLCASGLWSVSCTITQHLAAKHTQVTKSAPVSNDVVYLHTSVPVCVGSGSKTCSAFLKPPLLVECSILFAGVPLGSLLLSRSCPAMTFSLQTFLLDELSFLTEKDFNST